MLATKGIEVQICKSTGPLAVLKLARSACYPISACRDKILSSILPYLDVEDGICGGALREDDLPLV
jgi:hypothetical protein